VLAVLGLFALLPLALPQSEPPPCMAMEPLQASMGPQRPQNFHTISLGLLIMLPTLMFLIISFFMVFLSHSAQPVIWITVAAFTLVSLIFMNARKNGVRDGPNFWLNLGFLCSLATIASTAAGVYNWRSHTARYWAYAGQRAYSNVLPSVPALSHIDAGSIAFSIDAHLDLTRAASYSGDGRLFCVAPVVGAAPQTAVNYWAAGTGCCGQGGNFTCDAAADQQARSGLVYLQVGGFKSHDLDSFREAVQVASAAHGLTSSADALFVRWIEDPEQAQRAFWNDGIRFLVCSIIIYFSFSITTGTMLHCCRRTPGKSKLEDRRPAL